MLASERNRALNELASRIAAHPKLKRAITEVLDEARQSADSDWRDRLRLSDEPEIGRLWQEIQDFENRYMDIAYDGKRLASRDDLILSILVEMVESLSRAHSSHNEHPRPGPTTEELERRLLAAVGEDRRREAKEVLRMARLSWKLRDDDNLLLGRLESQALKALHLAAERLRFAGRLAAGEPGETDAKALAVALRNPAGGPFRLAPKVSEHTREDQPRREVPRQMIGQPAAPGMASGRARRIRHAEHLTQFRAGEVLVCDAIQPSMTHLVPLAVAVVERRGGMLIHGAIIARELGIPCVNGIPKAVESIPDGELVTVDGHLGIVTIGPPEFDLERSS
jgi:pyruvate,water dikinase